MAGYEVLENSTTIGLIIYIGSNGGSTKNQIYDGYKRNSSVAERIDELERIGLVAMTDGQGPYKKNARISLTDKGREVADLLSRASAIIEETAREKDEADWQEELRRRSRMEEERRAGDRPARPRFRTRSRPLLWGSAGRWAASAGCPRPDRP